MIATAFDFLQALGRQEAISLFWFALLLDVPRYLLGFIATSLAWCLKRESPRDQDLQRPTKVSILLAGHNEEASIERCVHSLREQSYRGAVEIIAVDDGSTDATYAIMRRLEREGLIERAIRLDLRGGKSAALNLAAGLATGEVFVVVDCDCSFDRHALCEIVRPLAEDPAVAAVSGNILVRNQRESVIAALQGIEYLISISLGKTLSDAFGQVVCVSGAFGAFRRDAWDAVGGQDVGPGEDFDVTFRLRLSGYRIRFARAAICYTDVPTKFSALARQRGRWERDTFWIRFRKYGYTLNPLDHRFRASELVNQLDYLLFTFLPTVVFPVYVLYLVILSPWFAALLLSAVSMALIVLDFLAFFIGICLTGQRGYRHLVLFVPLFSLFQAFVMRSLRLRSSIDELIFSRSLDDNYVPEKVRAWSQWR